MHISVPWVLGSEAAVGSGVVTRGKGHTILGWPEQGWGCQMGGALKSFRCTGTEKHCTSAAVRQGTPPGLCGMLDRQQDDLE